MLKRFQANKRIVVAMFLVVLAVMAFDYFTGSRGWNAGGQFWIWRSGLEWPATINNLLAEIWFAQFIALLFLPVILLLGRRVSRRMFATWAIVASILLFSFSWQAYHRINQNYYNPGDFSYVLHDGPQFFKPVYNADDIDPTLQSVFPYFLINEVSLLAIVFIVLIGSHYLTVDGGKTGKP